LCVLILVYLWLLGFLIYFSTWSFWCFTFFTFCNHNNCLNFTWRWFILFTLSRLLVGLRARFGAQFKLPSSTDAADCSKAVSLCVPQMYVLLFHTVLVTLVCVLCFLVYGKFIFALYFISLILPFLVGFVYYIVY
jgi:hypothetical protein